MPKKIFESFLEADIAGVWAFHSSATALDVLTPPNRKMRWITKKPAVSEGAIHEFQVKVGPFWITWKAELLQVHEPSGFVDTALKSPFKSWTHRREFLAADGGTLLRDTVNYEPPFGILGSLANWIFISKDIDRLFKFRHTATRNALRPTLT